MYNPDSRCDFVRRIDALERQNRQLKTCLVSGAAALSLAFLVGAQAGPKSVEAEKFVLKSNDGKTRAVLSHEDGLTALWLYDENGGPSAQFGVDGNGPALGMSDKQGRGVTMSVTKQSAGLAVTNAKSGIAAALGLAPHGPDLILRDDQGRTLFHEPEQRRR